MTLVPPGKFLAEVRTLLDLPYVWDAKGPLRFDCSGLITYALHQVGGPDWRQYGNCVWLWQKLAGVDATESFPGTPPEAPAGCLAFYGPKDRPGHVMVVVGDGRVLGACGGGPGTTQPTRGACVQYRSSVRYRPDFAGYRALELALE